MFLSQKLSHCRTFFCVFSWLQSLIFEWWSSIIFFDGCSTINNVRLPLVGWLLKKPIGRWLKRNGQKRVPHYDCPERTLSVGSTTNHPRYLPILWNWWRVFCWPRCWWLLMVWQHTFRNHFWVAHENESSGFQPGEFDFYIVWWVLHYNLSITYT